MKRTKVQIEKETKKTYTFIIRDPFAGEIEIKGQDLEGAIFQAYSSCAPEEIPTHVWHDGKRIDIPYGQAEPVQ